MSAKRGRPDVARKVYGDTGFDYTFKEIYNGQFRTKRSMADMVYVNQAIETIKEAASEIQDLDAICDAEKQWFSRGILGQLGRMLIQDDMAVEDVIKMAKWACAYKKAHPNSSKEIEKLIRKKRMEFKEHYNKLLRERILSPK